MSRGSVVADAGSVRLWPQSATPDQVAQIAGAAVANNWTVLKSGVQTSLAPDNLVHPGEGAEQAVEERARRQ